MKVELLVLANSAKHSPNSTKKSGRCLAGIDIKTGRWIRPVPDSEGSQILNECTKFNDEFIRPGDLIRIDLGKPVPQPHHPENFLFDETGIELIERNVLHRYLPLLSSASKPSNILVKTPENRILQAEVAEGLVSESLALVQARDIEFYNTYFNGQKKYRVKFQLNGHAWDISNTDDIGDWSGTFPEGLICLSLAELFPMKAAHYKLAAGFIPIHLSSLQETHRDNIAIEGESLTGLISEYFEQPMVIHDDVRLKLDNWFYQGQIRLTCLKCDYDLLTIFRAHESKQKDGLPQVLHRIAIGCHSCNNVYSTPFDDENFRKQIRDLSERQNKVKNICPQCN